jgi:hypothetical protein
MAKPQIAMGAAKLGTVTVPGAATRLQVRTGGTVAEATPHGPGSAAVPYATAPCGATAVLLARLGSKVALDADAPVVTAPLPEATVATTVMVAVAALASGLVPVQVMAPPAVGGVQVIPAGGVVETHVSPDGTVSLTVIGAAAVDGPRLVTVTL